MNFLRMRGWRRVAGLLVLVVLILMATIQLVESLSREPEIALEMGGTYEDLFKRSSASFSPLIRGHVWMGLPDTDARLRFIALSMSS